MFIEVCKHKIKTYCHDILQIKGNTFVKRIDLSHASLFFFSLLLFTGKKLAFLVGLTAMQMLKHWNVPQTRADGHDKPLPFTLKEDDISTYGCSD